MPVYSPSRLSSYENCPLMYKYSYVEKVKLEPEVKTIEAFMGSRVHEALEKLYRDLKLSKLNSPEDILAFYEDSWERSWSENVKIVREEYTPENYYDTGAKCIVNYYRRYAPFDQSRTLGLEQSIFIDLDGYKLRGFIDRLAQRSDAHYEIHDYKTSQYLPMQRHFDEDRQLALYQVGVEERWGDAERVDLIWHYLVHDKEMRSKRSSGDIARLKAETIALIEEIERAVEEDNFPARESQLCAWCEYQPICPRRMHIVKTSEMPINKYLQDPGVKLVNEYARLVEEKREYLRRVDEELAQLEGAIIAFAKKEGIEVIRGTDRKLLVRREEKARFPTKKEAERRELDELLKGEGVWREVSDLNVYSLAKAVAGGEWSRELVNKVREYQRLEESYRLYLSAMKE